MIELTEPQQQALDTNAVPRLVDPRTRKAYVLIGADEYERLRRLQGDDDGLTMQEVAVLVERAMRDDDEGDPTLEFYQRKYGKAP
jgi:hypothetical protein